MPLDLEDAAAFAVLLALPFPALIAAADVHQRPETQEQLAASLLDVVDIDLETALSQSCDAAGAGIGIRIAGSLAVTRPQVVLPVEAARTTEGLLMQIGWDCPDHQTEIG